MFPAFAAKDEDVVGDGREARYKPSREMASWTEEETIYDRIDQVESDTQQDGSRKWTEAIIVSNY